MNSNDDQHILESLISLPTTLLETSIALVDALERNIDEFAVQVRENLSSSTWLPSPIRPAPPPQPAPTPALIPLSPNGLLVWARHVVTDNTAVVAAVLAFAGTGGVMLWQRRRNAMRKRRKARRSLTGARKDAVVVAGAVNGTVSRAVLQDLERRGFVVYFAVSNREEEADVKHYANPNIKSLRLDISEVANIEATITQFAQSLKRENSSASLHLAGLVVIPSATSLLPGTADSSGAAAAQSAASLEQMQPSQLSDALNTSVLYPITMIKALLGPLIAHNSRIVLLSPGIAPSLSHSQTLTATVAGALDGFSAALAADLRLLDVPVIQMKLGKFEVAKAEAEMQRQLVPYGAKVGSSVASSKTTVGVEGSSLKELHDAVFDALMAHKTHSGIRRVGKGSWIYAVVERLAPWGSMRWRLGLRAASIMHL